ncbi:HD domain-containing phosphohydrolase [Caldicellulosiruptoraceae bacterium PP1]
MGLKIKILLLAFIISILPSLTIGIYVNNRLIPQFENNFKTYHILEQQEIINNIIKKTIDDIKQVNSDYAIWNEIYYSIYHGDLKSIKFYWSNWLPYDPFDYSIVLGINRYGEVIDYYGKDISLSTILNNPTFKTVLNKILGYQNNRNTIKDIFNYDIISGFIFLNNKVYAYSISPILDDMNLRKPSIGAFFIAKEINNNFLKLIKPYMTVPIYFIAKNRTINKKDKVDYYFIKLYDYNNNYIGSLVTEYKEEFLEKINKNFSTLFVLIIILTMIATLTFSVWLALYLSKELYSLENYAINLFSYVNGNDQNVNNILYAKNVNMFKRVKLVLKALSNNIEFNIKKIIQKEEELSILYQKEKENFNGAIKLFISLIEIKDPYTKGHAERVRNLSELIGQKLLQKGFKFNMSDLIIAAYLHDIGKIAVSESILNKQGRLSDYEFEQVKKHSSIGYQLLANINYFNDIKRIVLYHHENIDGSGYPEAIKGDQIPFESKIIAVADVFDALTTDRPYRKAFTIQEAINIMQKDIGKKFDKNIFDTFIEIINDKKYFNRVEEKWKLLN